MGLGLAIGLAAAALPAGARAQGADAPAASAAAAPSAATAPKALRPAWDPGRTIRASDPNYDGPVKTIYTPANAPASPALESLSRKDSVSQYGITWTFDKPASVGQFVTGDWYAVGPVTITAIDPKPLFGEAVKEANWPIINRQSVTEANRYPGKWARNGSVLNQRVDTGSGGFDSRLSDGLYDPKQFTPLPIAMKPGDSLISSISAKDPLVAYTGHGQPLLAAAVLTCVEAPQPADAFRPSYCDPKQKVYLARDLQRQLLYALPRPDTAPARLSEWARLFQRPWLDTVAWGYANPELNTPRYGQRMTNSVSTAALLLHLDYPAVEKEQLLVHTVQYGIDLWGIVRAGSKGWLGHGGFCGGRKWSIIFAGMMLGDDEMRAPNQTYPKVLFGEDTQTAWGKSWTGHNVVFTSHPAWCDSNFNSPELAHPSEWAAIRAKDRYRRGDQSDGYRRCCTSIEWPGQALAAHLMRAEKYWNWDPFFAYVDRWMGEEDIHATAKTVLDAAKAAAEKEGATDAAKGYAEGKWILAQPRSNPFFLAMWSAYRKNLPAPREGAPASGLKN
jgi:hypothetical protein